MNFHIAPRVPAKNMTQCHVFSFVILFYNTIKMSLASALPWEFNQLCSFSSLTWTAQPRLSGKLRRVSPGWSWEGKSGVLLRTGAGSLIPGKPDQDSMRQRHFLPPSLFLLSSQNLKLSLYPFGSPLFPEKYPCFPLGPNSPAFEPEI